RDSGVKGGTDFEIRNSEFGSEAATIQTRAGESTNMKINSHNHRPFHFATLALAGAALFSFAGAGWSQSNPSAFDLSSGSWTLTGWNSSVSAGKYPGNGATGSDTTTGVASSITAGNMAFHSASSADPTLSTAMNADYTIAYNFTSKTRISGQGANGISFVNTSSANTGGPNGTLGAAVLAIKTTGRSSVQVAWTGRVIASAGTFAAGTLDRAMSIRLQYRVGTSGSFTDVPGPVEYSSLASPTSFRATGSSQAFTATTLPVSCENQPVVQLRWFYYLASGTAGARSELAIDDITVSSSSAAAATAPSAPTITGITPGNGQLSVAFTAGADGGSAITN
ncbi:MAG: hypothetical protein EBT07_19350, partial [Actinobacteria bacterium]|nr:hypothetical protein [Actinomycetota bacterium]